MVGAKVPIINLEHQCLVTEPHPAIEALGREMPVLRDSYTNSYIRQEGKGFLVGSYETSGAKPWALNGMDWKFDRQLFDSHLECLMPFLDRCIELVPTFGEVGVSAVVAQESAAVQHLAGITDISGAAKFEIRGVDADRFLSYLSCNKVPAKDGQLGLTLFHGPNGGIMTGQSITRINSEHFYLIDPMGGEERDFHWMQMHSDGYDVEIENLSNEIGAVLITGPKSREILPALSPTDLAHKAFLWLTTQMIQIDAAIVRAIRVSYAGELGYELHMPTYQLPSIYQSHFRVGQEMGLRDFGDFAFNSMRMEKIYRGWGHEFTEEISGVEAGMGRFIDTTRDFIGVEVVREREASGGEVQLAYLAFDDDDAIECECFGNEAVFHNGEYVGMTTNGGLGHRVVYSLAFAYIKLKLVEQGVSLEVQTSLGLRSAQVEMDAVYDPKNELLRS
jgi:dimethylglycine dehydrogenase